MTSRIQFDSRDRRGECRENHPERVRFVVQRCGPWRECALARRAAPELDDLQLFLAGAAAGEDMTAAMGACLGRLLGVRHARDTWGPTMATPKVVKDKNGKMKTVTAAGPSEAASTAALASQIGLAVSNALKSTLQP